MLARPLTAGMLPYLHKYVPITNETTTNISSDEAKTSV